MNDFTSLFLAQSYSDAWEDYQRSLASESFPVWDYVILTASNEDQAQGYRMQLETRKGFLPKATHFAVIADEGGVRVGSGGATLSVIRYIRAQQKKAGLDDSFEGLRILVIHSGGDSKRVPTYSALGKLFSPVPHRLPDGRSSTLFDEFIIVMSAVVPRIRSGMLLLSGDVLLLFNPLQIDFSGKGAAAISFKEDVNTGKNHGVFLNGEGGIVRKFLHKQTVETLKAVGAVNEKNCVDIDTGAVILSSEMIEALYRLVESDELYKKYVNDRVRLSLYGDFLYPLAEESTLESFYLEKPEGEMCAELIEAREKVWQALRTFRLKLLRLAPAKFIHFGTTGEILALMNGGTEKYKHLGWDKKILSSINGSAAGYNSVVSQNAVVGENCYMEVSYVHDNAVIGENVLLSYVDVYDEIIPDNVVVHALKQKNGCFVCRIYGIHDNPKETKLFGVELEEILTKIGIDANKIWDSDERTLWNARLYPECKTVKEALAEALNLYDLANGGGNKERFEAAKRKSLCSGFGDADPKAIIMWNNRMQELVKIKEIDNDIRQKKPASMIKPLSSLTEIQKSWLEKAAGEADFSHKIRLYYYIGKALGKKEGEPYINRCLNTVSETILKETVDGLVYRDKCRISCDEYTVKLPLRVNFGGGWSDTPPVCCELGGTVLNAAISLNGQLPVEVRLVKIKEKKIVFDSRDMDVHGEFETIRPLQRTGDPYDSFALQKACLLACGIIPASGGSLSEILERLGGGFEMHSEVTNVPKGSGLGTSSILSAACVKAVFGFMGIDCTNEDIYSHVLAMEQIMSTGGGWQDQVGGLTNGVKLITGKAGLKQQINVCEVNIPEDTRKELSERLCLVYTGQRRLARNLLRDVVGRYIGNEKESVFALNEIQRMAALMRFELERGNVDEFAKLMDKHWELSKMIDKGSSNTLIEQIFSSIDDLICGRLVCGAGGGGFLQVILKKGVTSENVHKRLKEVFQDNPVDVWQAELV